MSLFKISFDFSAPSIWIKMAAVLMAIAALVAALPELPFAIDGVKAATVKIRDMLAPPQQSVLSQPQTPASGAQNLPPKPQSVPVNTGRSGSLLDDPAQTKATLQVRGLLDDDPGVGAHAVAPSRRP